MSRDNEIVMCDVKEAGHIIREQIYAEVKTQNDLYVALDTCRYDDDMYNPRRGHPYTPAHPNEVEIVDSWELPAILNERYNISRTAISCGMFPEIRRAWASIENSLFLWRFDKRDSHCLEYSVDEQAICAVGLAKVKAGVFVEAIQYLLILATPVELIIAGVCCSASSDGTDPYAQVSLQPLPYYKVPSDGVPMTCISCTDRGHIFLAGCDGHIYELQYSTGLGLQERCHKVCLTAGLGSVILRWVVQNVFKFGAVDPIVEMVIDNERHILYALTEEMEIQVFSLGANGDGPVRKVAAERNLTNRRDSYGGRQPASSRTPESAKTTIVSISPISLLESGCLHLVAVLSDGSRMYLSSGENNSTAVNFGGLIHQNPNYLEVVTTRPAPSLGAGGRLPFGAACLASVSQSEDLSLKIESSYYSAGTLVLSSSSPSTVSSLLIVNRGSAHPTAFNLGSGIMKACPLREVVSSVPIEGRMLFVADVLPLPDTASVVQSLYLQLESFGYDNSGESCQKTSDKLWAKRSLSTQHILPRRRIIIFSTMGMTEVVFNRPVDILRRLLESNSPRSLLEDFFSCFGSGESAAMCLMLAARIIYTETLVSNVVAERAAEAYEDPKLVGVPSEKGGGAIPNTRAPSGGFKMGRRLGQVVREKPFFSGAHEGLCLCSSRLLVPLWELPVFITKGSTASSDASNNVIIVCRFPGEAMQILEDKIRSLEKFLRSMRNQKRGLYGCVAGLGDLTGSILIGSGSDLADRNRNMIRNLSGSYARNVESNDGGTSSKTRRLPYSSAELAAMEVREMECIRQLLLRCSEALFLLQLLSQHHVTRLVQNFDANIKQALLQLTFNGLVCSEEGNRLAASLVSALVEDYTGADGVGNIDDISERLLKGCPSYYKESDHNVYLAVERLERAAATLERENLAREALNYLSKIPECADLRTVFKRFEDLRANDRSLKGEASEMKFVSPNAQCTLDQASRKKYIRLYRTLMDLDLEDELLEYGGPDLVFFLQNAGCEPRDEGRAASAVASPTSPLGHATVHVPPNQAKYLELLARYYVLKQQHVHAAHVLVRMAESRSNDAKDAPTLEQRLQYLSNAVVQAQRASDTDGMSGTRGSLDNRLLDLLKGKLTVLQFQIKIKDELQVMASRLKASTTGTTKSITDDTSPNMSKSVDPEFLRLP